MQKFPLALLLAGLGIASPDLAANEETTVNQALEQLLRSDTLQIGDTNILAEETILEIYQGNGFKPFWTARSDLRELLELIEEAKDIYNRDQKTLDALNGRVTIDLPATGEI